MTNRAKESVEDRFQESQYPYYLRDQGTWAFLQSVSWDGSIDKTGSNQLKLGIRPAFWKVIE